MWNRWRKTGPRMKDSVWSSVAVLMCLTASSKWSWLRWQFLTCAVSTGRSPWGRLRLLTCPQAKPWHDVDVRVKSFSNEHGGASFHRLLVTCVNAAGLEKNSVERVHFEISKSVYFCAHLVNSILTWLTRRPVALQLSGRQTRPSDKKHLEDWRKRKVILIYRLQQPSSSTHDKQYLHRIY